jgi:uncharacterized protein (DUF2147 family)
MKPSSLICTLAFFLSVTVTNAQEFKDTDLIGDWLVSEKTALISFFKDGDKFYGMTKWMGKPKNADGTWRLDVKNPDPSKRSRKLLGDLLCKNFEYSGDGVWEGGTIYDSRSGKTYKAKITMKDINTITLRGFIGISLIGGSDTWTRKVK